MSLGYASLLYIGMQYCTVYFWTGFFVAINWCLSVKIVSFTLEWLNHDKPDSPTQVSGTALSLKGVLSISVDCVNLCTSFYRRS